MVEPVSLDTNHDRLPNLDEVRRPTRRKVNTHQQLFVLQKRDTESSPERRTPEPTSVNRPDGPTNLNVKNDVSELGQTIEVVPRLKYSRFQVSRRSDQPGKLKQRTTKNDKGEPLVCGRSHIPLCLQIFTSTEPSKNPTLLTHR